MELPSRVSVNKKILKQNDGAALVLGGRRFGWELKRTCRPLWAKVDEPGGPLVSKMNYRKGNIQLYIPKEELVPGRVFVQNDAGDFKRYEVKRVGENFVDLDELPAREVKAKKDFKTRAAEPEPIALENDGGLLDNPLDDGEPLSLDALEAERRTALLTAKGFNREALAELDEPTFNGLWAEYGGGNGAL